MNGRIFKYSTLIVISLSFLAVSIFYFFNSYHSLQKNNTTDKKVIKSAPQTSEKITKNNFNKAYSSEKIPTVINFTEKQKKKNPVLQIAGDRKSEIIDSSVIPRIPKDTSVINSDSKIVFKKEPLVIQQIPVQSINQGEKFSSIDLKNFLFNNDSNSGSIIWEISGNHALRVSVNPENILIAELPDDDWYGVDTVILKGYNNSGISSSAKIIFEVKESELINRYPIKPVKEVLITGIEDILALITNPLRWEDDDIINAAAVVTGTVLLTTVDERINGSVVRNDNYKNNAVLNFGKFYGETLTSQCTALGLTLWGLAASNKNITRLGLEVFESYMLVDRITYLLKYSFGRDRPSEQNGNMFFKPFSGRSNGSNALPSGHAALAFSMSTVLSSCTDDPYLKALIYAPAFITAISRVWQNYHWTSDVFLGGAIGFVVGNFLVNRHNNNSPGKIFFGLNQQGMIGIIYKL